jgi:hypothetical protein
MTKWVRQLVCLHWIISRWKNLVFRCPSWSHCIRDFCLHKTSSWDRLSSNYCLTSVSCSLSSFVRPRFLIWLCRNFIWSFRFLWASKMFPKFCLIQSLMHFLKFFNICWNQNILEPWGIASSLHQVEAMAWNSKWVRHNLSNLKGLCPQEIEMSSESWIGQWSDLEVSRMLDSNERPSIKRDSDMRKRYIWHATYWDLENRFD